MEDFTIGGVLRDAARLIRGHFGLLFGLSLVLVALPKVLGAVLARWAVLSGSPNWAFLPGTLPFFGGSLLAVAIVRAAVEAASNRTPRFGDGLVAAFRFFGPVMGVSLVSSVLIGLGSILLLFPGVMLLCRWAVVVPVQVAEGPGVLAALRRSAHLTEGVRWRIFGLFLLWALLAIVAAAIGFGILGIVGGAMAAQGQISWILVLSDALISAIVGLASNLIYVSVYLRLRRVKEGSLSADLISAFD